MTGKEYAKKEYPNLEEGLKQILAKAFDMGKDNAERELEEKVQGYDRNRDRLISMGFPTFQSCKEYADKIKGLEQQIEKMKCCYNCDNWHWKHKKCEKKLKGDCFKASKWILRR